MKKPKRKKILTDILLPMAIAGVIVFTFTRFYGIGSIVGTSMLPTYKSGELFVYRKTQDVKQGDVVVFYAKTLKSKLVKRVIADENTDLVIKNGKVSVDGVVINEDYIKGNINNLNASLHVPRGYIYVMGDNRNHSVDSRKFGLVKLSDVYGRIGG